MLKRNPAPWLGQVKAYRRLFLISPGAESQLDSYDRAQTPVPIAARLCAAAAPRQISSPTAGMGSTRRPVASPHRSPRRRRRICPLSQPRMASEPIDRGAQPFQQHPSAPVRSAAHPPLNHHDARRRALAASALAANLSRFGSKGQGCSPHLGDARISEQETR
jgi:hypothetical protein